MPTKKRSTNQGVNKKRASTCSVCRKQGHTKRACEQTNTKREKTVFVDVRSYPTHSPHIVDLKPQREQEPSVWHEVTPYREAHAPVQRETIDFAALVRDANKKGEVEGIHEFRKQLSGYVREHDAPYEIVPRAKKSIFVTDAPIDPALIPRVLKPTKVKEPLRARTRRAASQFSGKKFAISAMAVLMVLILPFPALGYYQKVRADSGRVVEASTNAFFSLQSSTVAAFQADISSAQYDLGSALESFTTANSILEKDHRALLFVSRMVPVIGKQVSGRQHVLRAGHKLALGNTYLVKGIGEAESRTDLPMTERMLLLKQHLQGAIPQYEAALKELEQVDHTVVPVEYQQSFSEFKLLFATFIDDMKDFVDLADMMYTIFGGEEFKRYLIVFQNHHERRATGGFMGSFAILDTQKGKILNIDVPGGGTYDLQGQLTEYLKPPVPLQTVNKRWEFQDSNWFFDFPTSARKAEWFLEKSWGVSVDGVVAINASLIERLLRVVGPVEHAEYDLLLDADTVLEQLQQEVEVGYDKEENKPKQVLADLLTQLTTLMTTQDSMSVVRLLSELNESLVEKEVQVYMHDRDVQKKLDEFGWTGSVMHTEAGTDYLAVVSANLGGGKSDARVEEEIEHTAQIAEDGSIINTVVVRRRHTGSPDEAFYGQENVTFVRAYVPEGSVLLDVSGAEFPSERSFLVPETWYKEDVDLRLVEKEEGVHIESGTRVTTEFGKTVFGNWMRVKPGEQKELRFVYTLPFSVLPAEGELSNVEKWKQMLVPHSRPVSKYQLVVQKQSGTEGPFSSQVIYPDTWETEWVSAADVVEKAQGAQLRTTLTTDKTYGVLMRKK